MTIKTIAVTVGNTPTKLGVYPGAYGMEGGYQSSIEVNNTSIVDMRVGGSDVTMSGTGRGRLITAGNSWSCDLGPTDDLYGIIAGTTPVEVEVLQAGL